MKNITFFLSGCLIIALSISLTGFSTIDPLEEGITFIRENINSCYHAEAERGQIKRYELNFTNTGFCRYKRYFHNGKTEYFAFNLSKFSDLDFYGTTASGKLRLKTRNADVIVQTHRDRSGDVDSMSTYVDIPVKNIEPEQLNALLARFKMMGSELLSKK